MHYSSSSIAHIIYKLLFVVELCVFDYSGTVLFNCGILSEVVAVCMSSKYNRYYGNLQAIWTVLRGADHDNHPEILYTNHCKS